MNEILYRIIDANFNRAREAFRVMEEYCRFGLNHPGLAAKAKSCRHHLCEQLKKIDSVLLLTNRDVEGDVGKDLKIDGQQRRASLEDCFTAAAKRASEALRALAEATQAIDSNIAAAMEKLRFEVYSLEKQAVLKSSARQKFQSVRLYVLINAFPETNENELLNLTRTCADSGADCLQLRAKELDDRKLLTLAKQFAGICRDAHVISIINDRVDIALLAESDGVHLGQTEIPVSCARQLARRPLIVGVSTHNNDELRRAIESDCDYAGIGPAFTSPTKRKLEVAGLDYIQHAVKELEGAGIYHVAIGGIDADNLHHLQKIGVKAVAVSNTIASSPNPKESCKVLKRLILKNRH